MSVLERFALRFGTDIDRWLDLRLLCGVLSYMNASQACLWGGLPQAPGERASTTVRPSPVLVVLPW